MSDEVTKNEWTEEKMKELKSKAGDALIITGLGLIGTAIVGVGAKVFLKISEPRRKFNKINDLVTEIEKNSVKLDEMRVEIDTIVAISGNKGLDKELNKLKDPKQLIKDIEMSIIDVEEKVVEILSTNKTNDEIIRCLYKVLDRFQGQIKAMKVRFKYIKKELN